MNLRSRLEQVGDLPKTWRWRIGEVDYLFLKLRQAALPPELQVPVFQT
ncbi:MAG: hypothetical protein KGY81_01485 [Phycisphaerae bacterium]|nr:hypothetical protein [Phycisphaerae bacterium]